MSIWTQVEGRIDIHKVKEEYKGQSIDELVGMSWSYEQVYCSSFDDNDKYDEEIDYQLEHYPEKFMPYGSEGSIQKEVISTSDGSIIVFGGSLRDFYEDDWPKIETWFKDICNKFYIISGYMQVTLDDFSRPETVKRWEV